MKSWDTVYAVIALIVGIVLILLSASERTIEGPDAWLGEWTAWAAQYVALIIAAHKIWKLSDVLIARLDATGRPPSA